MSGLVAASSPAGALRVERIDGLDALPGEWDRLALASGNVFCTREWAHTWWRHHGQGDPFLLVFRDRAGEVAGLLPLYRAARGGVRIVRSVGHGAADRLGPACAPDAVAALTEALRGWLRAPDLAWNLWIGERVDAEHGWDDALGGRTLRRESSPLLRLDHGSWDALLASRSQNFRQQVRRFERRLVRETGARFRLADDPARLDAELETLFALHRLRWQGESTGFADEDRAFHAEFAAVAQERGWMRLWFAETDDGPLAAWYGFRYGRAEFFYQAGRDPAADRLAPGFVLMAHTIREAIADGQREFHLLLGDEPYKERFSDANAPVDTFAVPRGPIAGGVVAAAGAVARSAQGRHLLRRLTS
jgi:CelD/BcsL family acetyltransferase involved in cellulose biosynthesis